LEVGAVNVDYLEAARERISNVPLLINVVSRRVRQLNQGHRPLVKPDNAHMPNMDIALKEIAEGKLTAEIAFAADEEAPPADEKLITL
jgi:DNA-directed RNA polymerase subunit omega